MPLHSPVLEVIKSVVFGTLFTFLIPVFAVTFAKVIFCDASVLGVVDLLALMSASSRILFSPQWILSQRRVLSPAVNILQFFSPRYFRNRHAPRAFRTLRAAVLNHPLIFPFTKRPTMCSHGLAQSINPVDFVS